MPMPGLLVALALSAAPPEGCRQLDDEAGPARGFVAVVVAEDTVDVSSPMAGRLELVHVRIGDGAKADAPLAVVGASTQKGEVRGAEAALRSAQAELERSRARSTKAAEAFARLEQVRAHVAAAEVREQELEASLAKAEVESAAGRVEGARAALDEARERLRQSTVRAPWDATVAARYVDPGAWVNVGTPLVRLVSQELLVRFAVPQEQAGCVKVGTPVQTVLGQGGARLDAEVFQVAPSIEPASGMIFAEARLKDEAASRTVRPGTVARVFIR